MDKPKSYKIQNGCHNCAWVDRNAVAASISCMYGIPRTIHG